MAETTKDDLIMVKIIKGAVEEKGCKLSKIDFGNQVIKIDGPDEVIGECARAVADIV
ncbi:MAG: hypothetical protein QNJ58_18225 [Desulfobacterales bacterium]|nr:hypothetical protein [Desulfobacterales bacterium]